jgi:hypothetical protein
LLLLLWLLLLLLWRLLDRLSPRLHKVVGSSGHVRPPKGSKVHGKGWKVQEACLLLLLLGPGWDGLEPLQIWLLLLRWLRLLQRLLLGWQCGG